MADRALQRRISWMRQGLRRQWREAEQYNRADLTVLLGRRPSQALAMATGGDAIKVVIVS